MLYCKVVYNLCSHVLSFCVVCRDSVNLRDNIFVDIRDFERLVLLRVTPYLDVPCGHIRFTVKEELGSNERQKA